MNRARFCEIPDYTMVPDGKGHWISQGILRFYSKKLDLEIEVPVHSLNNLASIPRLCRGFFAVNGPHRPAAALHDWLYEGKSGLTRKQCDIIFLEAMLTLKIDYLAALSKEQVAGLCTNNLKYLFINSEPLVGKYTANIMYRAVRLGGSGAYCA